MSSALENVELKLAYLERANHELSDVVYRQQRELDALRVQLKTMASRFEELTAQATPYSEVDERPPHY